MKTLVITTLGGGSYFSPNHDETTIEVHAGIEEVTAEMQNRRDLGGQHRHHLNTLDGNKHLVRFPSFTDEVYANCWFIHYHDGMIVEDVIMRGLEKVHGGDPDFNITFEGGHAFVIGADHP